MPAPDPYDFLDIDSLLTDEEKLLRSTVRRFTEEKVLPDVGAWWEEGTASVTFSCDGAPRAVRFSRLGSSYAKWVEIGALDDPSPEQIAELRLASGLKELGTMSTEAGRVVHRFDVPVHEAILCEVVA